MDPVARSRAGLFVQLENKKRKKLALKICVYFKLLGLWKITMPVEYESTVDSKNWNFCFKCVNIDVHATANYSISIRSELFGHNFLPAGNIGPQLKSTQKWPVWPLGNSRVCCPKIHIPGLWHSANTPTFPPPFSSQQYFFLLPASGEAGGSTVRHFNIPLLWHCAKSYQCCGSLRIRINLTDLNPYYCNNSDPDLK